MPASAPVEERDPIELNLKNIIEMLEHERRIWVAAHGFNLGLQSAHILASEIKTAMAKGTSFAASPVLARYSSRHSRTAMPIYHGTNALVRLYTTTTAPAKLVRGALLHLGNIIKPAKGLIMNQLTEIVRDEKHEIPN